MYVVISVLAQVAVLQVNLTILTGYNCYSIQYKNGCLAVSELFHMLTQSFKLYTFHYHMLNSTDVEKFDSSNR